MLKGLKVLEQTWDPWNLANWKWLELGYEIETKGDKSKRSPHQMPHHTCNKKPSATVTLSQITMHRHDHHINIGKTTQKNTKTDTDSHSTKLLKSKRTPPPDTLTPPPDTLKPPHHHDQTLSSQKKTQTPPQKGTPPPPPPGTDRPKKL